MKVPSSSSLHVSRITSEDGHLSMRMLATPAAIPCYACVHDGLICPASARAAPELLLQHERMHNEAFFDERGARLSLVASRYGKVGLLYYTQL
jgi:hypothetical protein